MDNSVITTIFTDESGEIDIRITAEHPGNTVDFDKAEVYAAWDSRNELLGLFTRQGDELEHEGDELSPGEQRQIADFIKAYRGGDWDL